MDRASTQRTTAAGLALCLLAVLLLAPTPALAQMEPQGGWSNLATRIETDGSLGPQQTVTGENSLYTIGENLGTRAGNNLFHSFRFFDLGEGDTGRFTGSGSIENVVSRITGGQPSYLNGKLESQIAGADFYFLNPSGVFFGPGASLDVPAAFYTSTAHSLGFSDGQDFATEAGAAPVLSMANPDSFGFFGTAPIGQIGVDESPLIAPFFERLAFVGGDIEIANAFLAAVGGSISILSIASSGEAAFDPTDVHAPIDASSFSRFGNLTLRDGALLDTRNHNPDLSLRLLGPSGKIFLQGDEVSLVDSTLNTSSWLIGGSGDVEILSQTYVQQSTQIDTTAAQLGSLREYGVGDAGDITIVATQDASIRAASQIDGSTTAPDPNDTPTSEPGEIHITVGDGELDLREEGSVPAPDLVIHGSTVSSVNTSETMATGGDGADSNETEPSGNLRIRGERVSIEAESLLGTLARRSQNAGQVEVEGLESVTIRNSGLSAGTEGQGDSGGVRVHAPDVLLRADAGNESAIAAVATGTGDGGGILIEGQRIAIKDGYRINGITFGIDGDSEAAGRGSDIEIRSSESIELSGSAGMLTGTFGDGDAGNITLRGPTEGTERPAITFGTGVEVGTLAAGDAGSAGDISITGQTLTLESETGQPTIVNAAAAFEFVGGTSGNILVDTTGNVELLGNVSISNGNQGSGDAGSITVRTESDLVVAGGSIDSSTFGGESSTTGEIYLDVNNLEIRDGGSVAAVTTGPSDGGRIRIEARNLVSVSGEEPSAPGGDRSSIVATTAGPGNAGGIRIDAARIDVRDGGQILAESSRIDGTASRRLGNAGSIEITATEEVELSGSSSLGHLSRISTKAREVSKAGEISIVSPRLTVYDAYVDSSSQGSIAEHVLYDEEDQTGFAFFDEDHFFDVRGSELELQLNALGYTLGPNPSQGDILHFSSLLAETPTEPSLDGVREAYYPGTLVLPGGEASIEEIGAFFIESGKIVIDVRDLVLSGAANIQSGTVDGAGGTLDITASNSVLLSRRSEIGFGREEPVFVPFFQAGTSGAGNAGSIVVRTPDLRLKDGAFITTETRGTGGAGNVTLLADQLHAQDHSEIRSNSTATSASLLEANGDTILKFPAMNDLLTIPGRGGRVSVDASQVRLSGGSAITVFAHEGAQPAGGLPPPGQPSASLGEGNIGIAAREWVLLEGGSRVEASVQTGLGGSVEIGSPSAPTQALILRDGSKVLAQAIGDDSSTAASKTTAVSTKAAAPLTARGGDIAIYANTVLACPGCLINADGPTSNSGGSVVINNPETALEGQVMPPTVSYLDASSQLLAECGRAPGGNENDGGRFRVARWQELPLASDGPLLALSPLGGLGTLGREQAPDALPNETAPPGLWLAQRGTKPGAPDKPLSAETPPDAAVAQTRDAVLLNRQGHALALAGAGSGALDRYRTSAEEARASGQNLLAAQAESNAARTALALGEALEAKRALARARRELDQAPDVAPAERTALLLHLAESEFALARLDPASRSRALRAAHGDLLRAQATAEKNALPRASAQALGQLGGLYASEPGRSREARYLTHRAVQLAEDAQAADLLARFYAQLGQLEWQRGHTEASLDAYRRAVGILEETRPEADASGGLADVAFRQSVEPVYLALVDHLLTTSADAPSPAAQQERLDEARRVVEHLKAAELRNYFRDSCAAQLVASAQTAESLDPRAAVVYPIALQDRLELLVSRPQGIVRVAVPVTLAELESEVHRFRGLLTKRTTYEYEAPAKTLHAWLVEPYLSLLGDEEIDTLVFVPSGILRTIPMAALHDGDRFLFERYAVAVTPSLDLLAPKPLDPEKTDLLLVGVSDPVQGYPGLPGVQREIAAVEDLYGGQVLLDEDFDQAGFSSAVYNEKPGIVHLASHAEFTGDSESSFVLTHEDRLSMEELATLMRSGRYGDEPVELLLLSACETAVGDERAALGLAGVSIRAGARSAMGSLWSVSDDAASKLVVGFYEELGTPGTSKARALQRSQKKLLATPGFQHPYYWAPFQVMNNWL